MSLLEQGVSELVTRVAKHYSNGKNKGEGVKFTRKRSASKTNSESISSLHVFIIKLAVYTISAETCSMPTIHNTTIAAETPYHATVAYLNDLGIKNPELKVIEAIPPYEVIKYCVITLTQRVEITVWPIKD